MKNLVKNIANEDKEAKLKTILYFSTKFLYHNKYHKKIFILNTTKSLQRFEFKIQLCHQKLVVVDEIPSIFSFSLLFLFANGFFLL